jgi:hypothetical protein
MNKKQRSGDGRCAWLFYKTYFFRGIPFRSVPFRASELALPRKPECLGMSTFFRGITETVPSLFRGIVSERNSVPNPNVGRYYTCSHADAWLTNQHRIYSLFMGTSLQKIYEKFDPSLIIFTLIFSIYKEFCLTPHNLGVVIYLHTIRPCKIKTY